MQQRILESSQACTRARPSARAASTDPTAKVLASREPSATTAARSEPRASPAETFQLQGRGTQELPRHRHPRTGGGDKELVAVGFPRHKSSLPHHTTGREAAPQPQEHFNFPLPRLRSLITLLFPGDSLRCPDTGTAWGWGFFWFFFFFANRSPRVPVSTHPAAAPQRGRTEQRSQKPQPSPGPRHRALREVKALQEKPQNAARKEPLTSSAPDVTGQRPSACPTVSQQPKANFTNSSSPPAPEETWLRSPRRSAAFPNGHFCTAAAPAAPGGRRPTPAAAAALTPARGSTPKNPRLAGDRLQGPAEETGRDVLHSKGHCQVPIFNILLIFKPL